MVVKAAGALGASHICVTVHVQESFTNESIKHVTDALGGPADVTIECSGSPSAIRLAIHVTRPGGCVLLAGIGDNEVQIPLRLAATNEIDLKGILRYPPNRFTQALELISAGVIEVKPLVKHSFPLEKAREALEMAARRDGGKIVVECFKE
ncbi:hypothetical protein C0Q70_20338 [Pomacea canaliculata]|uniref:Alcohol dehydrogenase-like C-terminal domain-containing protein n=1 Tax=Pomacea canaliculata TaxID=400727 RepID=A0A2T7NFC0_POMCA|nr:hypothetical protein C0Q70_20338 [Pomacea canaliculata]